MGMFYYKLQHCIVENAWGLLLNFYRRYFANTRDIIIQCEDYFDINKTVQLRNLFYEKIVLNVMIAKPKCKVI